MAIKQSKTKETDYLFASARVRAAEARLIGADKLESAVNAKDKGEIEALVASLCENGGEDVGAYLASAYDFIGQVSPDENIAVFLRYPYDCNNIKSVIKCHFRGCGTDGMLTKAGSVDPELVKRMPLTLDFSVLPENMAKGAAEALEAYAKSLNPQLIDMILDRACYADMLSAAKKSGCPFAAELVRLKIDLTNLTMTVRCIRMGTPSDLERDILSSSLIDGGSIEKNAFLDAYYNGEAAIIPLLRESEAASAAALLTEGGEVSLSEIEKECDDIYMRKARSTKFMPFGAPLLISYAVAAEYTVKNARIILAGKRAGLAPEEIRRRVRLSYV